MSQAIETMNNDPRVIVRNLKESLGGKLELWLLISDN